MTTEQRTQWRGPGVALCDQILEGNGENLTDSCHVGPGLGVVMRVASDGCEDEQAHYASV